MKQHIFVLLFVTTAIFTTCEDVSSNSDWVRIPQIDGSLRLENVKELLEDYLTSKNQQTQTEFHLYTNMNPEEGVEVSQHDLVTLGQYFDAKIPSRFLIHGWKGDRDSFMNHRIRKNYLLRGDFNVFIVDWSSGASTWNYIAASKNVRQAGKQLAEFIDHLHSEFSLDFNTTYLVGHSLGAHVAGTAGKNVKHGKINTIFGLDPALPLFYLGKPDQRLHTDDALYVETMHTDAGIHGFDKPIGDASFYPNWGGIQPGCEHSTCSHNRAVHFFAESLKLFDLFDAQQCECYQNILNKSCHGTGKIAKMAGEPSNYGRNVSGEFYLPTNHKSPFALGMNWILSVLQQ